MLNEELWINRLATEAGVLYETSEKLWLCFIAELEQLLCAEAVLSFDELGYWSLSLRPEFVLEVEEGHYLCPPHLELVIGAEGAQAERRLVRLTELVPSLELSSQVRPQHILNWLQALPQVLQAQLRAGRTLACQGLGRFAPLEDGYTLELEAGFAEQLNKAFAMFPRVPLAREEAGQGLELVKYPSLDQALLHRVHYHYPKQEAELPLPPSEEAKVEEEVGQASEPSVAPMEQEQEAANLTEAQSEVAEPISSASTSWLSPSARRYWLVVLVLVLLMLTFFVVEKLFEPRAVSLPKPAPTETPQRDTIGIKAQALPTDSMMNALPYEAYAQEVERQGLSQIGRYALRETITLKPGASLMRIARAKYGNDVFWVYIYEENKHKMPNPKVAPVGIDITLPEARAYGIDPQDTQAVERAWALQRRLLK